MAGQPAISVVQRLVVHAGQQDISKESPYSPKLQLQMNLLPGRFLTGFSGLKVA